MDTELAGATPPNAVVPRDKQERKTAMAFQDLLIEVFNQIIAALVDGLIVKILAMIGLGA